MHAVARLPMTGGVLSEVASGPPDILLSFDRNGRFAGLDASHGTGLTGPVRGADFATVLQQLCPTWPIPCWRDDEGLWFILTIAGPNGRMERFLGSWCQEDGLGAPVRGWRISRIATPSGDPLPLLRRLGCLAGQDYLRTAVDIIGAFFRADFAYVGRLNAATGMICTVAMATLGEDPQSFEYNMGPAPCADVIGGGRSFVISRAVQLCYPEDEPLAELGLRSYAGVPLRSPQGDTIGILALLSRGDLPTPLAIQATLNGVADRCGLELTRAA